MERGIRSDNQTLSSLANAIMLFKPADGVTQRPVVNAKVVSDLDHGVSPGQIRTRHGLARLEKRRWYVKAVKLPAETLLVIGVLDWPQMRRQVRQRGLNFQILEVRAPLILT